MERPPNSQVRNPVFVRGENPALGVFGVSRRELRQAVSAGVRVFPVLQGEIVSSEDICGIVDTLCALPKREDRVRMARMYLDELCERPQSRSVVEARCIIEERFLGGEKKTAIESYVPLPLEGGNPPGRPENAGGRTREITDPFKGKGEITDPFKGKGFVP